MVKRKASTAISKTKARAITRKTVVASAGKGSGPPKQVLLAKLMEQHIMENYSVSFADIMTDLGMNDHNTTWRERWKDLEEEGYTKPSAAKGGPVFTSGYQLTPKGIELAATDEYKQALVNKPKTNDELHERIKGKLMNKRGGEIFDLLLERGPLTRNELSGILGISDRGAYFSYALQQLKDLGYAEDDPNKVKGMKKKVRLTDKAFLIRPAASKTEQPNSTNVPPNSLVSADSTALPSVSPTSVDSSATPSGSPVSVDSK